MKLRELKILLKEAAAKHIRIRHERVGYFDHIAIIGHHRYAQFAKARRRLLKLYTGSA